MDINARRVMVLRTEGLSMELIAERMSVTTDVIRRVVRESKRAVTITVGN